MMFCAAWRNVLSVLGVAALSEIWARAQSDSILCATDCVDAAAVAVGCIGANSVECSCLSPTFLTLASNCIKLSCSTAVLEEAQQNYNSECGPFIAGSSSLASVQTSKATAPVTLTITATIGGVVSTLTTAIDPATVTSSVAVQSTVTSVATIPASIPPGPAASSTSAIALPFTSLSAADRATANIGLLAPVGGAICTVLLGGAILGGLAVF